MSRAIEWILLGAGSCIAIIVGLRLHRPARVWPWLLLAGSVTCFAMGDVFYALHQMMVADICYLALFVLIAAALVQFTRGGSPIVDRARLIDLLACGCAILLVVWVFMIGGRGQLGSIAASDVLGDLVLLGVAVRLNLAARRNISALLLLTGSIGLLTSDIAFSLAPTALAETGYVVLYVTWGLAALHPSMVRLTEPMPPRLTPWRGHWTVMLGLSVSTPPLVLLIETLTPGPVEDGVLIAVTAAITLLLTITRLADAVTLNSQALAREQGLREASADLVSAADAPAVDEAVRAAVAHLVPPHEIQQILFATDDRQMALQALPAAASGPSPRSWWIGVDGVAEAGKAPTSATDPRPSVAAGPWWRRPTTTITRVHPDSTAAQATLVCPLWLEPLAVARPNGGALVLTGRREVLTMARDALEVLAGQAALALDRISLVEAVGRRDSDLYLRAVIRNTADLMLVIDEDRRIRYASPAVHELLGVPELSPLATLEDLVHSDDRGQVRSAFAADDGDGTFFCALHRADNSQVLIEATYRDLREDRLVQGFVVTMRNVTTATEQDDRLPHQAHVDELPAWVNRRSAQHKFRY